MQIKKSHNLSRSKKNRFLIKLYFVLIVPFSSSFLYGQVTDSSLLNLERIYSSREFASDRFGPARWLDDGTGYTTLEASEYSERGRDIVRYDPGTGRREVLVSASKLIPADESNPLRISNYSWSPNGQMLLIFTNTKRVWRRNTRGDYWVLNLNTWELKKLGGDAKPSTLMFAKFSPDAEKVGYVIENNIYVENISANTIKQLTTDGSRTIINGTFDWVYEEEFSLRDGFRWSPDSKSIAYWQLDAEGVREFYLINNTDSLHPYIIPIQYPKVGETNSACKVGVVSIESGETRWFDVPGDPRNNYIARMEWAANSDEIVIQHLNRHQNTNEIMLGDAHTGKVRTVITERDKAWVDVVDDLKWFDNGKQFSWISERDGWRHAYMISRDGKKIKLITEGDFDVINLEGIDEKGGWLYYIASPENPCQSYLYRVNLKGKGKSQRLTPSGQGGSHSYQISPNFQWAIHSYSTFGNPIIIELISLPEHRLVKTLVDNSSLRSKLNKLKRGPTEFFRINIGDGVELDGWMMKPYNFDPSKKYPVLFYVYGEPAGRTVSDGWGGNGYLWHLMLTQQGYIVMSVDNRGTNVPRGREWRKCIYKQIGILASQDQASAAREICKWNFVDPTRIGIWGWSGGGSMSLNAIFRYPDLYHTAMSVAPVPNQRYYDAIYQERYMRTPDENEEGFRLGSPVTFAHQLKGNLLIVHGTGDDNVHYQGTEELINELIAHNKHFTMMAYPNRSHGIYEGRNTTLHLRKLLTRYLNENLPPGTK